jgi:hypothetical protein
MNTAWLNPFIIYAAYEIEISSKITPRMAEFTSAIILTRRLNQNSLNMSESGVSLLVWRLGLFLRRSDA